MNRPMTLSRPVPLNPGLSHEDYARYGQPGGMPGALWFGNEQFQHTPAYGATEFPGVPSVTSLTDTPETSAYGGLSNLVVPAGAHLGEKIGEQMVNPNLSFGQAISAGTHDVTFGLLGTPAPLTPAPTAPSLGAAPPVLGPDVPGGYGVTGSGYVVPASNVPGPDVAGGVGVSAGGIVSQSMPGTFGERFSAGISSPVTWGGAAGAGIFTAGLGMLMGQKPADAIKQGIGTAVGGAVGKSVGAAIGGIGGPVGAVIGSFLGGMLCFTAGTPIRMSDGSFKNVEDLDLGNITWLGGKVTAVGKAFEEELAEWRGHRMSASHAVFCNGKWSRAGDVGRKFTEKECIVYPVVTENHLLVTDKAITADLEEIDENPFALSDELRLAVLNSDPERNKWLRELEQDLWGANAA